jgi:hypothetical protein
MLNTDIDRIKSDWKKTITDIKLGWKEIEGRQPQQQRPIP